MTTTAHQQLVVFLGPSLALTQAKQLVRAQFRPPARQGDVFRALVKRPRAIALIDGVFKGAPSVWHHEIRAALAAGVTVFGASSMGALRAAELQGEGMVGVGAIFQGYARGASIDDGDVALLHADAAHGFKPLTVPLVNVIATVRAATTAKVLTAAQGKALVALARATFFQDRRWSTLSSRWPHFAKWVQAGNAVDQKAIDARACLVAAGELVTASASGPAAKPFVGSSFVRRRRLFDVHSKRLAQLQTRADVRSLEAAGTKRLLLGAMAKAGGVTVTEAERTAALKTIPDRGGLAADEREFIAEIIALEAKVLELPERFVPDGPSRLEGLALEAVLRGLWR